MSSSAIKKITMLLLPRLGLLSIALAAGNAEATAEVTTGPSCQRAWFQCGGLYFQKEICCESGSTCQYFTDYFSQCVPSGSGGGTDPAPLPSGPTASDGGGGGSSPFAPPPTPVGGTTGGGGGGGFSPFGPAPSPVGSTMEGGGGGSSPFAPPPTPIGSTMGGGGGGSSPFAPPPTPIGSTMGGGGGGSSPFGSPPTPIGSTMGGGGGLSSPFAPPPTPIGGTTGGGGGGVSPFGPAPSPVGSTMGGGGGGSSPFAPPPTPIGSTMGGGGGGSSPFAPQPTPGTGGPASPSAPSPSGGGGQLPHPSYSTPAPGLFTSPQQGDSTYYGIGGSGNCGYDQGTPFVPSWVQNAASVDSNNPDKFWPVALGPGSFDHSKNCGMCLACILDAGNPTYGGHFDGVRFGVVYDQCPECSAGSIDWRGAGDGRFTHTWIAIECPVEEGQPTSFIYWMQSGSGYYLKFQVRNIRVPVQSARIRFQGEDWMEAPFPPDGDDEFVVNSCSGQCMSTFDLELTSVFGEVVVDSGISFGSGSMAAGSAQFSNYAS